MEFQRLCFKHAWKEAELLDRFEEDAVKQWFTEEQVEELLILT